MCKQIVHSKDCLKKINEEINKLILNGYVPHDIGIAMNPVKCVITEPSSHGMQMLKERGIGFEDVQNYINYAVIMFEQEGDQDDILFLYLSFDGGCVLVSASGKIVTAYSKDNFKPHIKEILKVVSIYGQ